MAKGIRHDLCLCKTTAEVFGIPQNKHKRMLLKMFNIKNFPAGTIKAGQILHGSLSKAGEEFDFPMTTKYGRMNCTIKKQDFDYVSA